MDIDLGLLGAVCREGMSEFLDQAITVEMLDGSAVVAYRFIEEHWKNYKIVPTIDTVYKETGLNFHTVPIEPLPFWSDQIKKRHLYETIKSGLEPIMTLMEQVEPHKVVSEMETLLFQIRSNMSVSNRPEPMFKNPEKIFEDYERAKLGITGVPTPWPSLNGMTRGWQPGDFALIAARPSVGKSLHPETPVIMADYSVRQVQHVKPGNQLLGPDSKPRNVMGVHRGREEMFEVIPKKGEPWKCNRSHILSLKMSSDNGSIYKRGQIFNLTIDEYLAKNNKFKHHAKLWRTGVDMPEKEVSFDPYLIGLWLGDGGMNQPTFSFSDLPLKAYLETFAHENGYNINDESAEGRCPTYRVSRGKGVDNPLLNFVRDFAVEGGEKKIPGIYKINSEWNRLKLLAGLLDTDGYLEHKCFEITTKYKTLSDDILFLARSLGFAAYHKMKKGSIKSTGFVGWYHKIIISGDVDRIPCLLDRRQSEPREKNRDVLVTGFELKSLGEGEYFGVELDGDHLYLLGDFTVTHNTWVLLIIAIWAWENGKTVLLGSTEMSHEALRRRAAALFCRLSYSKIRDGALTLDEEDHFKTKLESLKDDERFIILGDGFDVTLNSLEAGIIEKQPDLVCADGAYLFKSGGGRRDKKHEGMADLFNEFKLIAKRNKVPIVGTTQMNRPDKMKTGAPDLSRMAFSDNAGMVADWVFFLKQTKEMRQNKEMEIQPGKMRESDFSGNIKINFNFGIQDFTEVEDRRDDAPFNKAIGVLENMEFPEMGEDEPF